jgi:hypothetical protein
LGDNSLLPRLGVLGLTIDDNIAELLPPMRISGGVLIAAKMADAQPCLGDDLIAGHVIHAINGAEVKDIASLRARLDSISADAPYSCSGRKVEDSAFHNARKRVEVSVPILDLVSVAFSKKALNRLYRITSKSPNSPS